MTDQKKQEMTLRITQANKSQLVVILYELFFYYIDEAEISYKAEDMTGFKTGIHRAQDCLGELIASLNMETELARSIFQVYLFVSKSLGLAMGSKKTESIEDAVRLMKILYETYKTDAVHDTSGPVMNHTQTVYAGLTYGKTDLTENRDDGGVNRGFLA